jgi:ribosome-associated heat shock protein Hsp15
MTPMSRGDNSAKSAITRADRQRLDKWLWAARFYKTRTLAGLAIEAGQVKAAGQRVKPAHLVHAGERVSVRKGGVTWDVDVIALVERRGGAADAALLYAETPESVAAREKVLLERKAALAAEPRFAGRPTKRDRRKLEDFLNEP